MWMVFLLRRIALLSLSPISGKLMVTDIADATAKTYTLTQAEVGKVITVVATYTDGGEGTKETVTSKTSVPTAVVTQTEAQAAAFSLKSIIDAAQN